MTKSGAYTLVTAAEPYVRGAIERMDVLGLAGRHSSRVGPETLILPPESGTSIDVLYSACREYFDLPWVRHLAVASMRFELDGRSASETAQALFESVESLFTAGPLPTCAVQVWGDSRRHDIGLVRRRILSQLTQRGVDPVVGSSVTLNVFLAKSAYVGLNATSQSLSSWPGGRLRLRRKSCQISRSEFKLEELFSYFNCLEGRTERALDLGASPGGWSRILLERGIKEIVAVDPGELSSNLPQNRVQHVASTANKYVTGTDETFNVIVNDMRMSMENSVEIMLAARRLLRPGGAAVMTVKTSPARANRDLVEFKRRIAGHYEILFLRQLFHNRHEFTAVLG